ncbi:MAG: N-acetylmuramic acid 6-phosphate etherase [Clostridia bacterium]|nr:N-acetylmuramic acid 6-phosphate etherase [Clostridia bacterium]MBP3583048.1 N-acetylmuramic acid 6-phosphate etherase [Clostridia bacterium]
MLKTEMRNEHTKNIPEMETLEMMRVMQNENKNAAAALDSQLENIGRAVDIISERMKKGGRLFYIGCGTSGRLGVLDASECPPTYGVPKNLVIGIIAGGDYALRNAIEGAEDNPELGREDLEKHEITELDSVVGISVAGGARYVLGALEYAKSKGAAIIAITSNEGAPIEKIADVGIHPDTGAEVITGSTRMKAGTAHKMILNMISTAVMIRQGHVYENLMINLRPANIKLEDRMIRIVSDILEVDRDTAKKLLDDNGFVIRAAIEAYKA